MAPYVATATLPGYGAMVAKREIDGDQLIADLLSIDDEHRKRETEILGDQIHRDDYIANAVAEERKRWCGARATRLERARAAATAAVEDAARLAKAPARNVEYEVARSAGIALVGADGGGLTPDEWVTKLEGLRVAGDMALGDGIVQALRVRAAATAAPGSGLTAGLANTRLRDALDAWEESRLTTGQREGLALAAAVAAFGRVLAIEDRTHAQMETRPDAKTPQLGVQLVQEAQRLQALTDGRVALAALQQGVV